MRLAGDAKIGGDYHQLLGFQNDQLLHVYSSVFSFVENKSGSAL